MTGFEMGLLAGAGAVIAGIAVIVLVDACIKQWRKVDQADRDLRDAEITLRMLEGRINVLTNKIRAIEGEGDDG